MKPNYSTSMQFNDEDFVKRSQLDKAGISIIDTWRRGADEYLEDLRSRKKRLTR